MAFTSESTPSPSTSYGALVADTFLGFELEVNLTAQAITEAQEQLCQVIEVKQEEDLQWWMEKSWEEWMSEWDSVVLVDRKLDREAAKHAMVEIWKRWLKVSFRFPLS